MIVDITARVEQVESAVTGEADVDLKYISHRQTDHFL